MIRLAANLSTLYGEFAFPDRFAAAAEDGFTAVEMQFPYDHDAGALAAARRAAGVSVALINAPAGDVQGGERGLMIEGGPRWQAAIDQLIRYAEALECGRTHLMVGKGDLAGDRLARAAENLANAAARLAHHAITPMIEVLNGIDEPGYALPSLAVAERLREASGAPNVRLQFDSYHQRRLGEDPVALLPEWLPLVGHVQIAAAADRGEPDTVEDRLFLQALDAAGYAGFVGCEYRPRAGTRAGLGWRDALVRDD